MSNTPINYYTASQAKIYINGILLDECYDIQYSYRETKEPIYGYLSKFYDALIGGTVIITGSFTINYKHDQYLTQVLKKAKDPTATSTSIRMTVSENEGKSKKQLSLKEYDSAYKIKLAAYSDALKDKKKLVEERAALEKQKREALSSHTNLVRSHENEANNAGISIDSTNNEIQELFMASGRADELDSKYKEYKDTIAYAQKVLSSAVDEVNINRSSILGGMILAEEPEETIDAFKEESLEIFRAGRDMSDSILEIAENMLSSDAELQQLKDLYDLLSSYNGDLSTIHSNPPSVLDIKGLEEQIILIDGKLKSLKPDSLRQDLINLKSALNSITVTDLDLKKDADESNGWMAAENSKFDGFTLEFNYNGAPHKRLVGCSILGHAHQVNMSGQPIKTYVQFISKAFEYETI